MKLNILVRLAVICAMIGLLCVLLFLWIGFRAWSVGLGVFFGMPMLVAGMALYIIAVVRDLKQRNIL